MPSQASHRQVQATTKRATRPSMFERMMQSFESKGETAIKKDEKRVGQRKGEVSEKPMLRNLEWRNFITDTAKLVCLPFFTKVVCGF